MDKREAEGTDLRELALKYGIPRSTLSDRLRGGRSMRESMEEYQALLPYQKKTLIKWVA
jgi:transcriptional regulator with XRE-family HTH domain